MIIKFIYHILNKKLAKQKHTLMRMQWKRAELEKLIEDYKADRITPEVMAVRYREIEERWG